LVLDRQAHYSFYESLPNAITGEKADVTIRAISNPSNYIIINSFMASSVGADRPFYFFETERLRPGLNGFSLILDSSTTTPPYFDYCEISYIGNLTPTGDVLDFTTGGLMEPAKFQLIISLAVCLSY